MSDQFAKNSHDFLNQLMHMRQMESFTYKYLDEVVKEIKENSVVQIIIDNATKYMNVEMTRIEKMTRLY